MNKRLTDKDWHRTKILAQKDDETTRRKKLHKLWELENAEEQGLIVRLPCKVGDCAWFVKAMGQYSTIISTNVSKIEIIGINEYVIHLLGTIRKIYLDKSGRNDNAFLSRAEAEKKLKELKGEK